MKALVPVIDDQAAAPELLFVYQRVQFFEVLLVHFGVVGCEIQRPDREFHFDIIPFGDYLAIRL